MLQVHSDPIHTQTISAGKHAYSMLTRVSIRWPPEDAYENTDTTVICVNNFFVDLRVEKQTRRLDWAIAGVRLVDQNDPSVFFLCHELNKIYNILTLSRKSYVSTYHQLAQYVPTHRFRLIRETSQWRRDGNGYHDTTGRSSRCVSSPVRRGLATKEAH